MNFKLSKLKLLVTIIILVIWYIFLLFISVDCSVVSMYCPPGCDGGFTILPKCCECISFNENLKDLALIILPVLLVYLIWSLIEKKR